MNIFLDIETVPTSRQDVRGDIAQTIRPPGNYKKPESIEKWLDEHRDEETDKLVANTALSGTFGEILMIGFAVDDSPVQVVSRDLAGAEKDVLVAFWHQINLHIADRPKRALRWIGHNVLKFDMRFLFQRSIIHQVRPHIDFNPNVSPGDSSVFDTMLHWAGWRDMVSLDDLCKAFDLETKPMHGSEVWQYAKDNRIGEIEDYCMHDVESVRKLYHLFNFGE
jgi:hypothetical protein